MSSFQTFEFRMLSLQSFEFRMSSPPKFEFRISSLQAFECRMSSLQKFELQMFYSSFPGRSIIDTLLLSVKIDVSSFHVSLWNTFQP